MCTGLALAITLLNLALLYGLTKWVEDFIFESLLEEQFLAYQVNPAGAPPAGSGPFWFFPSLADAPEPWRELLAGKPAGIYEIDSPESISFKLGEPHFDGIQPVLAVDTSRWEYIDQNLLEVAGFAALTLFIAVGCSITLGVYLIRRTIRPLNSFTSRVRALTPGEDPRPLASDFPQVEIGRLAEAFDDLQERLNDYVMREKRFTAEASHELRTPLTIVGNAVDLLEEKAEGLDHFSDIIARIRRGVIRMETLVETFLTLARDREDRGSSEFFSLEDILEEATRSHNQAFPRYPITVHYEIPPHLSLLGDGPQLAILARNLIGNAAFHGSDQIVRVTWNSPKLYFENSISSRSTGLLKPPSTGIGLAIVERICEHLDYAVIREPESEKYVVAIAFRADQIEISGE